jgi:hypothetical protein
MYGTLPAINKQGSSRLSHYRDKLVHDTTGHISIFMFCFLTKESFIFLPGKKMNKIQKRSNVKATLLCKHNKYMDIYIYMHIQATYMLDSANK